VVFHLSLDYGEVLRNRIINFAHQQPDIGSWLIMGLTLAAVFLSAGLAIRFSPESSSSGIPHLKTVITGHRFFLWLRVLIVKFISTVIASSGGLMVGRGGPNVHMGGAIGQGIANLCSDETIEDRSVMVVAGGGAGLTAAFNSPLAGLMFVLEELDSKCTSFGFFTAAIACLTADMVCRVMLGQSPVFHLTITEAPALNLLVAFLALGIVSGFLGSLFNKTLLAAQKLTRLGFWPRLAWWILLAAMVAAVNWFSPRLSGGGEDFINSIFAGSILNLNMVLLFFVVRFVLTVGCSSSGVAGGIFMPVLVLGALLGFGVGSISQLLFPGVNIDPKLFAVVGMASYFTGVVQAPLTGIVLLTEMTGNYTMILPLFVACFSAQITADVLGVMPLYEALTENDLRKEST
jgi:chloride channel protein, CIC family